MTRGLLLDTHVLLWLEKRSPLASGTLLRTASAAIARSLYLSDVSIWELGVAITKRDISKRPDLEGLPPAVWVDRFARRFDTRKLPISAKVMAEAALVPAIYGSGDPGDCFLIATARVHNLSLVTRDDPIIELAQLNPGYLSVIPC
jgi:PIN domain nuclease of toxin-antitoxin system